MIILDWKKTEPGHVRGQLNKYWNKESRNQPYHHRSPPPTPKAGWLFRQSSAEDVTDTGSCTRTGQLFSCYFCVKKLYNKYFSETTSIGGRGEKRMGIRMKAAIRRKRDYWNTTTIRKGDYRRHCMCLLYAVWVGGWTMTTMMTQVSINLVLFLPSWVKCCICSNFLSLQCIFWRWSCHMSKTCT